MNRKPATEEILLTESVQAGSGYAHRWSHQELMPGLDAGAWSAQVIAHSVAAFA